MRAIAAAAPAIDRILDARAIIVETGRKAAISTPGFSRAS
jgi:hypothetical protein